MYICARRPLPGSTTELAGALNECENTMALKQKIVEVKTWMDANAAWLEPVLVWLAILIALILCWETQQPVNGIP